MFISTLLLSHHEFLIMIPSASIMSVMSELLSEHPWQAIFLLLSLILLLSLVILRGFSSGRLHLPPAPPKLPLIGNLHQIGSPPHRSFAALSERYGPLMLLRMGKVPALVVSSAEMAREIMRTHDGVFCDRPPLKAPRILMYGATDPGFAPYGDYWRHTKKIIVHHLLGAKKVQSYRSLREEEVALLMHEISDAASASASTKEVDMSEMLSSFITDLICRVVSGERLRRDGRNKVVGELVKEAGVVFMGFFFEDFFPALGWLDELLGLTRRAKSNSRSWDAFLDELIDEHLPDRADKDEVEDKDFLHSLLAETQEQQGSIALTRENIKAILMDLFTAGTDTTSVTIEWALAELVKNPEIMKKAQREVRERASGRGMVRSEELDKMVYLRAVIKEAMRLHPTGPLLLPRESMEDCQVGGYFIPRRTRVFVNAWAISRDARFWEKPEEFDPERFLMIHGVPVDLKGNDFQLIPFGAGRRICTGLAFAMASVELSLANLLQQFDWELPAGIREGDMSMDEAPGFTMRRKVPLRLVATPWKIS